ncbi:MFS general substrate transporter [Pilatotrama ljubarskyi]|nr:MFS general substrate transporter [Pilatotrama ljubarskyi]
MAPDAADHPKTWSRAYQWYITYLSATLTLNSTFASSAPTGIISQLVQDLDMEAEVATLTITLFVADYCVGPLLRGPLSEQIGRKPVFVFSFLVYTGFQVGCALSLNTASILVFPALSGIFAAAPLANSGAVISDIWDADTRGTALALFCAAPFAGPTMGPIVSGFISVSGVSWRYDSRYWAPLERNRGSLSQRVSQVLARPVLILSREPMLLALTIYASFVYGIVYIMLEAYPIVFTEAHRLNAGLTGITFLPMFFGTLLGISSYLSIFSPRYRAAMQHFAPHLVPPEYRLEPCIWAAPIYALSFFWFAWTSYPSISLRAPLMAGVPMGAGIVLLFLGLTNYMVDAYLPVAASALSVNIVMRSLCGAAFPLFATQMYESLNPR